MTVMLAHGITPGAFLFYCTTVASLTVNAIRWINLVHWDGYDPVRATWWPIRWGRADVPFAIAQAGCLAASMLPATPSILLSGMIMLAVAGPRGLPPIAAHWRNSGRLLAALILACIVGIADVAMMAIMLFSELPTYAYAAAVLGQPYVVAIGLIFARPLIDYMEKIRATSLASNLPKEIITIGVTGSYGKSSTVSHIKDIASRHYRVAATENNANDMQGLSALIRRCVPHLADVLVAEMGMYRRGEILEMISVISPHIAIITAIGANHLERTGSIANTVSAKLEVAARADLVIVAVKDCYSESLLNSPALNDKKVIRCTTGGGPGEVDVSINNENGLASIRIGNWEFSASTGAYLYESNLACALAVAFYGLRMPTDTILNSLADVRSLQYRRDVYTNMRGINVIDNRSSYNSAGFKENLLLLNRIGKSSQRLIVCTPGIFEAGAEAVHLNRLVASQASCAATHLVIYGRTNRSALVRGASVGGARVVCLASRAEAASWVDAVAEEGDIVLWEGRLPLHYP
jgi:UDP-N-acetylmuramoyl-tripeptide--D-alanyl-D-alanine ligase